MFDVDVDVLIISRLISLVSVYVRSGVNLTFSTPRNGQTSLGSISGGGHFILNHTDMRESSSGVIVNVGFVSIGSLSLIGRSTWQVIFVWSLEVGTDLRLYPNTNFTVSNGVTLDVGGSIIAEGRPTLPGTVGSPAIFITK